MLTLKRFKAMIDSYGANPQRWPQERRGDAAALLCVSAAARAMLDEAQRLDIDIHVVSRQSARWQPEKQQAALARLRAQVQARIATDAEPRQRRTHATRRGPLPNLESMPSLRLGWAGITAAGGLAIAAGLLVGVSFPTPSPVADLGLLLQSAPIHILAE